MNNITNTLNTITNKHLQKLQNRVKHINYRYHDNMKTTLDMTYQNGDYILWNDGVTMERTGNPDNIDNVLDIMETTLRDIARTN